MTIFLAVPHLDVLTRYILDSAVEKQNTGRGKLIQLMEEYKNYKSIFVENIEFDPNATNLSRHHL